MSIRTIGVTNFKSFSELDVELRPFNVLVGPNSAGKSSFVEIFRFLRDIASEGLDNAISMQGGVENIRNARLGRDSNMTFRVSWDSDLELWGRHPGRGVKIRGVHYTFTLKFKQRTRGREFWIAQDSLKLDAVVQSEADSEAVVSREGSIRLTRLRQSTKGHYAVVIDPALGLDLGSIVGFGDQTDFNNFSIGDRLLLEAPTALPFFFMQLGRGFGSWSDTLREVGVFDFDPKLAKRAVPLRGRRELEEDGSNLALVLRRILKTQASARSFSNLISGLLPFVSEMSVKEYVDRSALLRCREVYNDDYYVPGPLLSDGTVNVAALVVALYFEQNPLTIIEEPERNLHPALVRQLVEMMRSASEKNQILVTTHNPEFVKYSDLDDLLLVNRDPRGFSSIVRPSESSMVQAFLEQDLGLDDLYVMNLLGSES